MAQNIVQTSIPDHDVTDELFYAIIERLKAQKALPRDSFNKEVPFFNFSSISKESQIKELFQDASDPNFYKSLIKNMMTIPEDKNGDLITKRISAMQVMSFAQMMIYKILPCPEQNCPNRPREIATHNQYKDYEYECPFYHHDKDKRRLVITPVIDEEFIYKANYYEEGKRGSTDKDKHSQNYFESMFHPLYYKMFRCKRDYCNFSSCCPFYHSEEEKKTWDRVFSNFIRKDRISYVKDKQKYYETNKHHNNQSNSNTPTLPNNPNESKILRSGNDQNKENNMNNSNSPTERHDYYKPSPTQHQNTWRSEKSFKPNTQRRFENSKRKNYNNNNNLHNSPESPEGNSSPVGFGHFVNQKSALTNRAC